MAYDSTKPISSTNSPEGISGNIATTPTGAQINMTTGQLITPPPMTPVTPTSLQPVPPLNVAPQTPVTVPNVANLPITTPVIPTTPASTDTFTQQLENTIAKIQGIDTNNEVKTSTAEQQRALNEINTQIKLHQANALAAQEKALQSGETLSFASGEAQRVAHNDAIEAIRLSALAQAAQGNLSLASELATNAIDEKYKQLERDAITQRNNIINNYDSLTPAQKKRADATLLKLNAQDAFVADKKQKEKDLTTIGNTAAANGAPLNLVQQAIATEDTIKANAMLHKYVGTKTAEASVPTGEEQLYSGLNSATATATRAKVAQYKTEPIVTNFAQIQSGYNFVKTIPDSTKNPADDQALIYSLAKVLDPGSVVREGEYATAQKYAQSWINAYGKGIEQAILGTGFLSQTARKNIKATIETKYKASKVDYDNTRNQYISGINNLTGRKDGEKFINEYALPNINNNEEQIKKDYEEFLKTLPSAQSTPSPSTLIPTAPKSKLSGIGQNVGFDNIFSLFQ